MKLDTDPIAAALERGGWKREVAGDTDFDAAVAAIKTAADCGLGLLVSGEYGVGKTALAYAAACLFGHFRRVRLEIAEDIEMLGKEWMEMWSEDLYAENVLLDDVGAELPQNVFGVRFEPVANFVSKRHERQESEPSEHPPRLFITTNLGAAEIDARYGGRLYSRLKDLCVPLRLGGKDKRRWKTGKEAS